MRAACLLSLALFGCVTETSSSGSRTLRSYPDQTGAPQQQPPARRGAEHAAGPRPLALPQLELPTQAGVVSHQDFPASEELLGSENIIPSPFQRFHWNLIEQADGRLTKIYYFRSKKPGAAKYVELMRRFVPGFAALREGQDYHLDAEFLQDPRRRSGSDWKKGGSSGLAYGALDGADLLAVTAPEDMLRQLDQFLVSMMAEAPQVEIETTIVEITVGDELNLGMKSSFVHGTEDDPKDNLIDSVAFDLAQNLVQGAFGTFSAIHDSTVINGLIELLQTTTHAEVLSSPKLAVLNGHRAVIDTGSETPFFTPTFNAAGLSRITTEFKPTGIKVVVLPFIQTADMVQLDITVEVSSVTGFVTAGVGNDAEVENPLISRRNAYTVVNVPSGQAVLIGGLVTSDELETVDKVPLLGDIPLLGYLFKRKTTEVRKAQVLFFVKPRIIHGHERFDEIYDPFVDFADTSAGRP